MATLEAELVLNMSEALGQVDELASAIGDATEDVTVNVDVNLDDGAFDGLFDELDSLSEIPVEVEAELGDIDGLFDELDALAVPPVEVEVTAPGAPEAEEEIEGVGDAAAASTSSMDGLGTSTAAFGAAAGLAGGSADELAAGLAGFGPGGVAAAAGIAAVAGSAGLLFSAAVQSVGSTQRFGTVLGEFAAQVDSVELGGLVTDLEGLAVMVGQDDEALRNSVTTLVAYGQASGVAGDVTAQYAEQVTLLAARATALKPTLEIGGTIDGLSRVLATGGARLGRYGLDIGTVTERQEIANEVFGRSFQELNRYEQSVVGAEAATRNLGASLERDIIANSENVQVKLQAISQQFQNTLETLGEPLILPVFDLLEAGLPIAESFGRIFSAVGTAVVPVVTAIADGLAPAFESLASSVENAAPSFAELGPELGELAAAIGEVVVELEPLFTQLISEGPALDLAIVAIDGLTRAFEGLAMTAEFAAPLLAELFEGPLEKGVPPQTVESFDALQEAEAEAAAATEAFVSAALGALPKLGGVIGEVASAGDAFGILNAASDPELIRANIEAMGEAIAGFTENLRTLRELDLEETFSFFAEQGLEGAPALANLVDATDAERARFEESLAGYGTIVEGFESEITEGFTGAGDAGLGAFQQSVQDGATQVGASAAAAGTAAATGLGDGFALAGLLVQGQMSIATALLVASGVLFTTTARQVGVSSGGALGVGFATSVGPGIQVGMSVARVQIAVQGASLAVSAASTGRSVGNSLGQGISQGIRSSIGSISQAAADAVNQAEDAARRAADANSPSRLFAELGKDMGRGLEVGFAEAAGALQSEAERITFASAAGAGSVGRGASSISAPTTVNVVVNGDATPETARMVRDGARDGVTKAQETLFDVGAA